MNERIIVRIPGPPTGKGRPRMTRQGRVYTPAKTRQTEGLVRHLASEAMAGRKRIEGAVLLLMSVRIEPPPSWSKRKRQAALSGDLWAAGKPDLDNIIKLIGDAFNGVIWSDDRQVVEVRARKEYADRSETVAEVVMMEGV